MRPTQRPAHKSAGTLLSAVVALVFWASPAHAQGFGQPASGAEAVPEVTRTLAITGARIVQAPGRVLENGTVVIRDGLILAVGTNVEIPYDARVIPSDSMTVYAGFIDGLSHAGLEKPKPESGQPRVDDRGNPPDDVAGIQPQRDVREMLKADDKSISELREAGFGAAHVVPYGRMLPGMGAIILLHGTEASDLVLKGGTGLFAQFAGARGVYPGTPMGITAKFRQLYREASRRHDLERAYATNPVGRPRTPQDAVHTAFFPVIDGSLPVIFYTKGALEARRALSLRQTLGFPLMLAGLDEGFDLTDALVRAGVPLLVTLSLPDRPKWMARMKQDSLETVIATLDPSLQTETWRELEAEVSNLKARQARSQQQFVTNPAVLHDAGLRFGFATLDTKPADIHKNLRAMVEAGLSEDVALAALTTDGADALGIGNILGSVDVGKIGNLVITDGPLFAEKTHIRTVIVEGARFEVDLPKTKTKGDASPTIVGTWAVVAMNSDGPISGTLTVSGSGGTLDGRLIYEGLPSEIDVSIHVVGNTITFRYPSPDGEVRVRAEITGDKMEGTATVENVGDLPVSGTRNPTNR